MKTAKTKKLINNTDNLIEEMLDGVLAAHPHHLRQVEHYPRGIIAKHGPREGKVGLMIGGGSGHEPTFLGFVGKGLADTAAIGNVFASSPPDPAVECAKAITRSGIDRCHLRKNGTKECTQRWKSGNS
jgi:dihydroxyacetone kinase-like protein